MVSYLTAITYTAVWITVILSLIINNNYYYYYLSLLSSKMPLQHFPSFEEQ